MLGVALLGGLVSIAFLVLRFQRAQAAPVSPAGEDPDVEQPHGSATKLATRPPRRYAILEEWEGDESSGGFSLKSDAPTLARMTGLTISLEGWSGRLREKLGFPDLKIGDSAFDADFTLSGSDPEAVRAVLSDPSVQAAVWALFTGERLGELVVERDGRLTAEASPSFVGRDGERKALLLDFVAVADELERAAANLGARANG